MGRQCRARLADRFAAVSRGGPLPFRPDTTLHLCEFRSLPACCIIVAAESEAPGGRASIFRGKALPKSFESAILTPGCGRGDSPSAGSGAWRSLASASEWGSEGRRFESSRPDNGRPDVEKSYVGPSLCARRTETRVRDVCATVDLPAVIPPTSPTSWSSTGQGPAVPAVPPIVGQAVRGRSRGRGTRGVDRRRASWSSTGDRCHVAHVSPVLSIVAGAGQSTGQAVRGPSPRPAPPVRPIVAGLVIDRASCSGPSPRPCRPRCRSSAGKLVIDRGAYHGPHVSPVVPIVAGLVIDRAAC